MHRRKPCRLVWLAVAVALSACAGLGARVQGQTEVVAWQATDLKLEQRSAGGRQAWTYSFDLLVSETRAIAVTFEEIETMVYQPGTSPRTGRYRGRWRLGARDRFRIPLRTSLSCPQAEDRCARPEVPLWRIVMRGTDARGQRVGVVIDLSLPADPPVAPPSSTSRSVRAIELAPPRR